MWPTDPFPPVKSNSLVSYECQNGWVANKTKVDRSSSGKYISKLTHLHNHKQIQMHKEIQSQKHTHTYVVELESESCLVYISAQHLHKLQPFALICQAL